MIRICVDSASDISINNSEDILVVPLSITLNDKTYLDGIDIQHNEFYELLINTDDFPKTSQPSPQSFVEVFEKVKEANDELICVLLSSGVSGTYQSAILAKSIVDYDKIHIIDSLTGAYGVRILVSEVQKGIKEGLTALQIVEKVEKLKKHVQIYISVDTLEYLYKGGRLDKASAIIGGIAKVKPVIEVTKEGTIDVKQKTIGMVRAMNTMAELVTEQKPDPNYPIYTIYTLGEKNVEKLENKLANHNLQVSERVQLGPVVGAHVGPETFGIIFITSEPR